MTYRRAAGGELWSMLKTRGWNYILIAVADVEGNYVMVLAYHYTSLTSVQILDSFAIIGVMILSWRLLKVGYKLFHYIGVVTCLAGSISLIFADAESTSSPESASNPALGDVLVLFGATLLSISNVGQEYLVKKFDWIEFVGMIGILGSLISGIQL
jgi:solute carrier family 35 protein F1/2